MYMLTIKWRWNQLVYDQPAEEMVAAHVVDCSVKSPSTAPSAGRDNGVKPTEKTHENDNFIYGKEIEG